MPGPFGVTFAPTDDGLSESAQQQALVRRSSTPLKVYNLELPTTLSPRAPVSRQLLEPSPSVGGGFNPDAAVLASIVRALTGSNSPLPGAGMTTPTPQAVRAPFDADGSGNASERPEPSLGAAGSSGRPSPIPTSTRDSGPSVSSSPDGPLVPEWHFQGGPGEGPAKSPDHFNFDADSGAAPITSVPVPPPTATQPTPGPFGGDDSGDDWARRERELNGRSQGPFTNVAAYKRELYGD